MTEIFLNLIHGEAEQAEGAKKFYPAIREGMNFNRKYGSVPMTKERLQAIADNCNNNILELLPMVNWNHDRSGKAAGWVQSAKVQDINGISWLMLEIEWTDDGKSDIDKKLFRYLSIEIDEEYINPVNGATIKDVLVGVALTNSPLIKGQEPLAASEKREKGEDEMDEKILEAKEQEIQDLKKSLEEVSVLQKQLSDTQTELESLKAEKAKVEAEIVEKQRKDFVDTAIKEGRITRAFADSQAEKIFSAVGLDGLKEIILALPKQELNPLKGNADFKEGSDPEEEVLKKANEIAEKQGVPMIEAISIAAKQTKSYNKE